MTLDEAKLVADLIEAKKHNNKVFLKLSCLINVYEFDIYKEKLIQNINNTDNLIDEILSRMEKPL